MTGLGVGRYGVLALIMLMYLVLGCLMDAMAMIILTVPIVFPVVTALGFDPIWFGIIIVMTVELGLIHPPVGMNVFVIKTAVKDVSFATIFKGVLPFIATDMRASRHLDRISLHRALPAKPDVRSIASQSGKGQFDNGPQAPGRSSHLIAGTGSTICALSAIARAPRRWATTAPITRASR